MKLTELAAHEWALMTFKAKRNREMKPDATEIASRGNV